jgi:phage baseplate assembly protein W
MSIDANAAAALLGGPVSATTAAFPVGAQGGATEVAFPFQVTPHGRVASATWEQHVEQMIEQVLFTAPGERVNRPDFGCGVMQLVFAAESDALVTATQFLVQGSLQRWLGDLIVVNAVVVQAQESTFAITVQYTLRESGSPRSATFIRAGSAT